MATEQDAVVETRQQPPELGQIAKWVLWISGGSIILVSSVALWSASRLTDKAQLTQTSQLIFNALLPLLGTWVGTVLAYYFSRQNFESASSSVERLVAATAEQRLGKLSVGKEMMQLGAITTYPIPKGKTAKDVPLSDLKSRMTGKITRLPIVNENGVVQYILHQSGLFKFIADQALAGKPVDKLTLQELVDDAELKAWVSNIVFVPETSTVAAAKALMEARPGCQDLVVTKSGSKDDPMLGWMTNVDIGRLSKA